MKEVHYMISDAAKKVDVESHVLRYWEEELKLPIQRNEMGHRYYTEENIQLFQNIKSLKDQGFQLKAIKLLLPELGKKDPEALSSLLLLREELNVRAEEMDAAQTAISLPDQGTLSEAEQKLLQFQQIVGQAVRQIMEENNRQLIMEMSRQVSKDIAEDLDGLLHQREQRDEERFRMLDAAIWELYPGARTDVTVDRDFMAPPH